MTSLPSSGPPDYDLANKPQLERHVKTQRNHHQILIDSLGPGCCAGLAQEGKGVTLNNYYLRNDIDPETQYEYHDDRLIVVLYHEIGHLEYFKSTPNNRRSCEDSEFAAFRYSLEKTKDIASNSNDVGPLTQAVKYIQIRQKSGSEDKDYQKALDRIIDSELWRECANLISN